MCSTPITEEDKSMDVYSFAMVIWESLHRIPVWAGLDQRNIESQVCNNERPGIASNILLSEDVVLVKMVDVMKKSWCQFPSDRIT